MISLPIGFTELRLEPRVGFVSGARSIPADARPSSEPENGIVEAFERCERRLLLVGPPGSGKTVLAYKIAEHLDRCHQDDPSQPIPVALSLSSWTPGSTVNSWVSDRLCDPIGGLGLNDRNLANWLVRTHRLALILDGLDEIGETNRPSCLTALNAHIAALPIPPAAPLVVTCRTGEYKELIADTDTALGLLAAREPLALDPDAVKANIHTMAEGNDLQPGNRRWLAYSRQTLGRPGDQVLQALASPFLMALVAETGFDPDQLHASDPNTISRQVCTTKVAIVLDAARPDTERWIVALAKALKRSNRTLFYFEHLTPPATPPRLAISFRRALVLFAGLLGGLFSAFLHGFWTGVVFGTLTGLLVGWLDWIFSIARVGSGGASARPSLRRLQRPTRRVLATASCYGSLFGLLLATPLGLTSGLRLGLLVGIVVGLYYMVARAFEDCTVYAPLSATTEIDQGIRLSILSSTLRVLTLELPFGLALGLFAGLKFGLLPGLLLGILSALVSGLLARPDPGGVYVVLQALERRRLRRAGVMPADPLSALRWAIDQGLMHQVGGGLQFRHLLLRDAVAERDKGDEIPLVILHPSLEQPSMWELLNFALAGGQDQEMDRRLDDWGLTLVIESFKAGHKGEGTDQEVERQ